MHEEPLIRLRKKLIEVDLPLDAINIACAHEKMPGIGPHPRGLHQWWARRPLPAARAVVFAQMVDDPSSCPESFETPEEERQERDRLFSIIRELVKWENTTNETVLEAARLEMANSWQRACADNAAHPRAKELFDPAHMPAFHDPFAGGGSIPLEALRLGLDTTAADLNPIAVMINRGLLEIPPRFAGRVPVNPVTRASLSLVNPNWGGTRGLADDVRYYAKWMRDKAYERIGHIYPDVEITRSLVAERPDLARYLGRRLQPIAWLWVRTVRSPNPAFHNVDVPLATNFILSTKSGQGAYVQPVIESKGYRLSVKVGRPDDIDAARRGTKLARGAQFECLMSGAAIDADYIKREGMAGRIGTRLMAIVVAGDRGRVYLSPSAEAEEAASTAAPDWIPDLPLPNDPRNFWTVQYGFDTFASLFTPRQLVGLGTLVDLLADVRQLVEQHAIEAGSVGTDGKLGDGSDGPMAYAEAISVYLAFAISRCADYGNASTLWASSNEKVMHLFGKQSVPMAWDFPEAAILNDTVGGFEPAARFIADCLDKVHASGKAKAVQQDAATTRYASDRVVSTDPPYYDNVAYADLSDFFYVWMRRALGGVYPDIFTTVASPKSEELVASPYRHGSKSAAESFFVTEMTEALRRLREQAHPAFPITVYYAFKQSESSDGGVPVSTGWQTFLDALIQAGFSITGTWPVRSEQAYRMVGRNTNALASSIVVCCRPRPLNARSATRQDLLGELRRELPTSLVKLQQGNIAPVDLAQAVIGPGMAVYTGFARVVDAEGNSLPVRDGLRLINDVLDESLAAQEGDFDAESRWALAWFADHGFEDGPFGDAHTYLVRFNTAENALLASGIILSGRGKVRLLRPSELARDWDPALDRRLTSWEAVHHLVRSLETEGEAAAGSLAASLGTTAEAARELAYRLYVICERKKWPVEALSYNGLVLSWPEITRLAREQSRPRGQQTAMFTESGE